MRAESTDLPRQNAHDDSSDRSDTDRDAEPDRADHPPQPPARRGWWIAATVGVVLLVLVLIVAALVPMLLSTDAGSRYVAAQISEDVHGDVRIGSLSLTWFGPQTLRDVVVVDEQGREALLVDRAQTELPLIAALRGRYNLGQTELSGVRADVVVDEAGETNLARALRQVEPVTPPEPARVPPSLQFNLAMRDAHVTVYGPDDEAVVLEEIRGVGRLASITDPLQVELRGRSRYAGVEGSFAAEAHIAQLFAADGTLTLNRATGSGEARADDLPVPGIDRLLNMDGLLTAVVGDLANLAVSFEHADPHPRFMLAADAPRLRTELRGVVDQQAAALDQPGNVNMQLEPELAERLLGLELTEAVPIELELTDLRAPMAAFDPARTAITGTIRFLEPATFIDEQGQPFTMRNVEAELASENLAELVRLRLTADLDVEEEQGELRLAGTVGDLFDEAGQVQWGRVRADLVAEANNLPTVLVDRLAQQDGLLIEALGDRVSLAAETSSVGADEIDAQLQLTAPRLETETMHLHIDADAITLTEPVRARMLIAPRVASQMVAAVTLAEPEPAEAIIHTLRAPRPAAGEPLFQPERTQLDVQLTADRPIHLIDLPAMLEQGIAEDFELRLNGPSLGDLHLTLRGLLSDPDDQIVQMAGSPIATELQAQTGLTEDFDRLPMASVLSVSSNRINGRLTGTVAADFSALTVTEASTLNVRLTRQMLEALDLDEQIDEALLREPVQLTTTITRLHTTLPVAPAELELEGMAEIIAEDAAQRTDAFAIWLGGESARLTVQAQPTEPQQQRVNLALAAERVQGEAAADLAYFEDRTMLTLVEPATFEAMLSEQAVAMLDMLQLNGEPLVVGEVPIAGRLETLSGQVQPLAWQTITAEASLRSERVHLARAALAMADQPENEQPAAPAEPADELPAAVGGTLEQVQANASFSGEQDRGELHLAGFMRLPDEPETGRLRLDATASQVLREGQFDLAAANVEADVEMEQVPTRLVAGFVGWPQLAPLLGPLANLTGVAEWDGLPPREGLIDAQLETANLTLPLPLQIAEGFIELVRPTRSVLMLTPEGYDALVAPPAEGAAAPAPETEPAPGADVEPGADAQPGAEADEAAEAQAEAEADAQLMPRRLVEPGEIELQMQQFRWPIPGAADDAPQEPAAETDDAEAEPTVDLAELALVASLRSEALTFAGRNSRDDAPATLSFDALINGEDLSEPMPYELTGRIRPAGPVLAEVPELAGQVAAIEQQEGRFHFAGSLAHLLDARGRPDFEAMQIDLEGEATDLPVAWLDDWTGQEGMLFASLGPELDLNVSAHLQQLTGSVALRGIATNGQAEVVGDLDQGVFRPTQAMTAALSVTEPMGSRVLLRIHPIFETAVSSPEPMRLNVPYEGVIIPLRPFDLSEAEIPVATLDVGRLLMRRGQTLAAVLAGLELLMRRDLETEPIVEAWFSPAEFELTNGRLNYQRRVDLLIDRRVELASWGEVDFRQERVALLLGMPGAMLDRLFGVPAPGGAMLTLPMRGRLGEVPETDWGRAATDVGRLAGQARLAEQVPFAGELLGSLFDEVLDTEPPPPSVSPLPWAEVELADVPEADLPEAPEAPEPDEPEPDEPPSLRDLLERLR